MTDRYKTPRYLQQAGVVTSIRVLLLLLACAVAGCGSNVVPVSGRITFNGEVLRKAHVTFYPVAKKGSTTAGPSSTGVTDDQGRYSLRLIDPEMSGALVGKHRVQISTATSEIANNDSGGSEDEKLPGEYTDGTIIIEVPPGGTDKANFKIVRFVEKVSRTPGNTQ